MYNNRLITANREEDLWHQLVSDGEKLSGTELEEDAEAHLVFSLMRNYMSTEVTDAVVAILYNKTVHQNGSSKLLGLKNIADICLLRAGFNTLIPRRFRRMSERPDEYFRDIGIACCYDMYAIALRRRETEQAKTFKAVADGFEKMVLVLRAIENTKLAAQTTERVFDENVVDIGVRVPGAK